MSERMNETRLKLWIGFWKFFLGIFVIGFVTAIINYQIQSREVDLKDREIILKDKQAEFREMERLGEFVTHALAENVAVRRRFSQYFSTVTRSSELRERWKEYAEIVETEYQGTQKRKSDLEKTKKELQNALAEGKAVESELERVKYELSKAASDLEVRQKQSPQLSLGVRLSDKVYADAIFTAKS